METINICLKVSTNNKKAVKESFQLKQVRKFSSASELKNFILTLIVRNSKRPRLTTLKSGFTALREGRALPLMMKPPWLRRIQQRNNSG